MVKILVVDDCRELRTTLENIIKQANFSVETAENADQALALLQKDFFHLILLDMVMPGTYGTSAIPLIRKLTPRSRIIIITGFASTENAVQAMQLGANDYLCKPFNVESLLTTIHKNLQEASFSQKLQNFDYDGLFQALANMLRRQIIILLADSGEMRFMDLVRALEVENHTKVNFHLKILREFGLLEQNQHKHYRLTAAGTAAASCLNFISESMEF